MDLILSGVSILVLLAVWHFMLRKSILDDHRDRLFDLRDELRHVFIANGWAMDTPLYKRLRDQINGYLRFTERYSFAQFVFLEKKVAGNPDLRAYLKTKAQSQFPCVGDEQHEYVEKFRRDAVNVMMSYMILSSGPLLILSIILLPIVAVQSVFAIISGGVAAGGRVLLKKATETRHTFMALVRVTVATLASKILYEDFVEEYSYRQAREGTIVQAGLRSV